MRKLKIILTLGASLFLLVGCGDIADNEEPTSIDTVESSVDTSIEEVDKKEQAVENAKQFPADSVSTFVGEQFKGMDYHFKGKAVGVVPANTVGNEIAYSLLVEADNGYVMLIAPYYEPEEPIEVGQEIEAYGHLNGLGYDISERGVESINNEAGLINAYEFYVDGQQLGIDIF